MASLRKTTIAPGCGASSWRGWDEFDIEFRWSQGRAVTLRDTSGAAADRLTPRGRKGLVRTWRLATPRTGARAAATQSRSSQRCQAPLSSLVRADHGITRPSVLQDACHRACHAGDDVGQDRCGARGQLADVLGRWRDRVMTLPRRSPEHASCRSKSHVLFGEVVRKLTWRCACLASGARAWPTSARRRSNRRDESPRRRHRETVH